MLVHNSPIITTETQKNMFDYPSMGQFPQETFFVFQLASKRN